MHNKTVHLKFQYVPNRNAKGLLLECERIGIGN